MNKINILNKVGMLSDKDRKEPLSHGCDHFTFESCIDLSKGVKVIPYGSRDKFTVAQYTQDVATFFVWWTNMVLKDLNGFSGLCHVKFELVGFELVNKK